MKRQVDARDKITKKEPLVNETCQTEEAKTKRYSLRKRRCTAFSSMDEESAVAEAIKRSKAESIDTTSLDIYLRERNLRTVEVDGDGNCFYRAVAHQYFGDPSRHDEIRRAAVEEVLRFPNRYQEFVLDRNLDEFVAELSTTSTWLTML